MGVLRRRRRRHNYSIATLIAAIILVSIAAGAEMKRQGSKSVLPAADQSAAAGTSTERETTGDGVPGIDQEMRRRRLIGSWPPACKGSCGRCRPCKAVRVTIHPGVSVPLDYYPEAWRCKCRNKLFLP